MANLLPPARTPLIDIAPLVVQLARVADALEANVPARQAPPTPLAVEPAPDPAPPLSARDQAVLDALRKWRSETARKEGLPAYIVAYNATLREVATKHPATLEELQAVRGFGPAKLARYGAAILEIVAA